MTNLADSSSGSPETMAEALTEKCSKCGGMEKVYRDCWNCGGEGEVEATLDDAMGEEWVRCCHCSGRGWFRLCAKCAPPEEDDYDDDEDARLAAASSAPQTNYRSSIMTLAQLQKKLAALPKSWDNRTIEVAIGEAAGGQRLVVHNVVEDDNCGGEIGIIVIEANYAPE